VLDGKDVILGGAANEFTSSRNVVTYTGNYTDANGVFSPASSAALTASVNSVDKSNTAITETMLGIFGATDVKVNGTDVPRIEALLDWASGVDIFDDNEDLDFTDPRLSMGDPLHSQPALVQYDEVAGVPELIAFVATNDGYLHAFNTSNGSELFSFIPQELLPNLNEIMENDPGSITYGLDGDVVAWVNDQDGNGKIDGTDHVYLYVGMRRGGKNIYSVDVTNSSNPTLRWVIKGGVGDYAELGETWSAVNVEKIKDGSTEKTVLIFGGGHDINQDTALVRNSSTVDSVGRAVFIADADTGALLWSAGPGGDTVLSEMKYSIPGRVKPLDMSGDGFTDRLYVADTGGQIFRFDIDNASGSLAGSITGGRIADLAKDNSAIDTRRFYYPPDVALIAERGKSPYLALSIASGYRAHPLDTTIRDRIYLLKDTDIYNTPTSYVTLTEANLYDATLNLIGGDGTSVQNDAAKATLATKEGWYINLDDQTNTNTWVGEKGLSETLLLEGSMIVTTFIPTAASTVASCGPQEGKGRVYFLDILDGTPTYASSSDSRPERHKDLKRGGIPPSITTQITKRGNAGCVGTECSAINIPHGVRKTYWYEVEK
jgi:type IV pilus assembly protein PilY1